MTTPAIRTIGLTKHYGNLKAAVDINLTIMPGDVFACIGPNGAGKTTTIKMLTGILVPTSGSVLIEGIDIMNDPVGAKQAIGHVPDRPFLYEKLTGSEFLRMIRDIYRSDRQAFKERSDVLIERFAIADRMDEMIENYSHGMKQKLILIAAFSHDPAIYIMDEPLVGLDPRAAKTLKNLIAEESSRGRTFFISTHILSLVEELCRTVAIIDRGTILLQGTIDEVRAAREGASSLEDVFIETTGTAAD